jgi:hypothetical protein
VSGPGAEPCANGAVEQPLAGGAVHLISAHEVVPTGGLRRLDPTYIALCGKPVDTSSLSGPDCPNECECEERGGITYCPGCVREALRWKAQPVNAAHIVAQLEQLRELVARDGR